MCRILYSSPGLELKFCRRFFVFVFESEGAIIGESLQKGTILTGMCSISFNYLKKITMKLWKDPFLNMQNHFANFQSKIRVVIEFMSPVPTESCNLNQFLTVFHMT